MFADELRRAVETAPRTDLTRLSTALWKAYAAGSVPEDDAQALAETIEARKRLPPPPQRRRVGSRPRSPESLERRRHLAASGPLPPALACRFTVGELAALRIVADEVRRKGLCDRTLGEIAARAGVCRTTVQNALRQAQAIGLLTITERRLTAWRNAANVVRIVSPEWQAWLKRGGGFKFADRTGSQRFSKRPARASEAGFGCRGAGSDADRGRARFERRER